MLTHVKYFKYTIHIEIVIELTDLQSFENCTECQDIPKLKYTQYI